MKLTIRTPKSLSRLFSDWARTLFDRNFFDFESRLMPALLVINDKHLISSSEFYFGSSQGRKSSF